VRVGPLLGIYLVLFAISFSLVLVLTPLTMMLARRLDAMDHPDRRKVHRSPIPRLGGLALIAAIGSALIAGAAVNIYIRAGLPSAAGILAGLPFIIAIGLYDDLHGASPILKLLFEVAAAGIAIALGIRFQLASNPLAAGMRDYFDLGILSIPLTMVWMVGLTNAMNLIDGLDGLATGIAMFASIALFLISMQQHAGIVTYFYVTIAGATLGFLRFAKHPARVFLGDCGSTFLGFLLACLSVLGTQKSYTLAALFIPLIVFGIPIFDVILSVVRRYLSNSKVMDADLNHIHHQLLHSGLNQRQAVVILYGFTVLFGIIAFAFTFLLDEYAAVILAVIGLLGGFTAKELYGFGSRPAAQESELKSRTDMRAR
jgi:UDP-GlcNAc:undecaprenyl-phosphate GlcNAc-1-phosphate transferase